jgi:hypothetical protein
MHGGNLLAMLRGTACLSISSNGRNLSRPLVLGISGEKTHAEPAQKGTPVKIPEPEGWTEYYSFFLLYSFSVLEKARKGFFWDGRGIKWEKGFKSGTHMAATLNRPLGYCS